MSFPHVCGCCLCLALSHCVAMPPLVEPVPSVVEEWPPRRVVWQDDFLGIQPLPVYSQVVRGRGYIDTLGSSPGGVLRLWTDEKGKGVARLRLGEDPGTGKLDSRNWLANRNLDFRVSVLFNTNEQMQATIGFVGLDDPNNVVAAIYNAETKPYWIFQVQSRGKGTTKSTTFRHKPKEWTTFQIKTDRGKRADLYIQGKRVATIGDYIPETPLCMELQIWNQPEKKGASWAKNMMSVDLIDIGMDRY